MTYIKIDAKKFKEITETEITYNINDVEESINRCEERIKNEQDELARLISLREEALKLGIKLTN